MTMDAVIYNRLINNVVGREHLFHLLKLTILLAIGAMFELVSVGVVAPVVSVITNPDKLKEYKMLGLIVSEWFGNEDNVMIAVILVMALIYIIKNLYLGWLSYFQYSCLAKLQLAISSKLFKGIAKSDYNFFVQTNLSDVLNSMTAEINSLVGGIITPVLGLIAELIILFSMIIMLFFYDVKTTFVVMAIGAILTGLFYYVFRKKIFIWGNLRQKNSVARIGIIKDLMRGAKEIKVLGREEYYVDEHSMVTKKFLASNRNINITNSFPRLVLETIAIISILVVAVINCGSHPNNTANILPAIALYGAVSFRMLPAFNRIITYLNQLKFNRPCITKVSDLFATINNYTHMNQFTQQKSEQDSRENFDIRFDNVSFKHDGANSNVLNGIDLIIKEKEKVGIIGESGAGKTTLVDMVLGLIRPTNGVITINDHDIIAVQPGTFAYVPQDVFISDESLKRNVALGVDEGRIDEKKVHGCLELVGLSSLVSELPNGVHTLIGEDGSRVSGGQRQRIGIARAIYNDSKVIVFDEATSALDYEAEHEIVTAIKRILRDRTVIMVAHRISTLKDCDKIVFIKNGTVAAIGTYGELLKNNDQVKNLVKHGII